MSPVEERLAEIREEISDTIDAEAVLGTNAVICAHKARTLLALVERYREALDELACWDEGAEVTTSFDSPWTAKCARHALAWGPEADDEG
jgi:hypothetical protein